MLVCTEQHIITISETDYVVTTKGHFQVPQLGNTRYNTKFK